MVNYEKYTQYLPHIFVILAVLLLLKPEYLFLSENTENKYVKSLYKNRFILGVVSSFFAYTFYKSDSNNDLTDTISSDMSSVVSVPSYKDSVTESTS